MILIALLLGCDRRDLHATLSHPLPLPRGTVLKMNDGSYWTVIAQLSPGSVELLAVAWYKQLWWRLRAWIEGEE